MSAYMLTCIDKRLAKGHHKAIKELGYEGNCYLACRAGGAASAGAIFALRKEARLVGATVIILAIHSDCKGCTDACVRLRNLKANAKLAKQMFPGKPIITVNIGIDGSYSRC